jgi:antagonist of KipI
MATMTILRPGMLTTVQDLGRWGHQDRGVPVAGPMDSYSHRLANRLAGNVDEAAALEVTLLGPELETDSTIACAVAGADFELTVDGVAAHMHERFTIAAGARVRFGARRSGTRATLAVHGGFDVPPTFGSRATSVVSRMGPFGGRPLARGDRLALGGPRAPSESLGGSRRNRHAGSIGASWTAESGVAPAMPVGGARVRVILGPHAAMFTPDAVENLLASRFIVTSQSNRMGYRLEGPALRHARSSDILSDATPMGSLQVPASGQPILLMADRQTTGGYPKIATVISADLPVAGQLAPGDWIEFAVCTREAALAALRGQEAALLRHGA